MSLAWFVYNNEVVTGPFSTEDVREKVGAGIIASTSFIWWKGQREWTPISGWEDQLLRMNNPADSHQKPVWYIDNGSGQPAVGPLAQSELIQTLLGLRELGRVRLWAVGMESWTSLFEFHEVMEQLGISRRSHERAPVMGSVAVNRSSDDPRGYLLRAASISIAGMGFTGDHDLRRDDEVAMLIKSSDLGPQIHLRGTVAYVTENGYVGVRFHRVPAETVSCIADYVRRFNEPIAKAA